MKGATVEASGSGLVDGLPPPQLASTLRNGAVYAAAAAFQRGIIFFLLPVYTRVLDPAAYGRLSVLLAIAAAGIIVLSFGMDTAFYRTYFALRDDPDSQGRFVTTAWVFLMVVPPAIAGLLAAVAAPIFAHSEVVRPGELAVALAGAAFFVSASIVPLALLRAAERLRDYLVLTSVTGGATATLTLVAVVGLKGGVTGWLIAVVVANAMTLVAAVRLIPLRLGTGIDRRLLTGALVLGVPLIPHTLSHWGLGVSNRVVLAGLVSTSEVGVYALAANIALPVAIAVQGMAAAFMPTYARAATEEAARLALPRVVIAQFLVVLTIAVIGTLISPIAVHYLAPPEYGGAAELVPWMTAGYGLLGLYFLPMNAVSQTAGRTGKVWIVTLGAAGANLVCLLLLVPAIGLVGAAIGVTIGYLILLVGVAIYSHGPDNPVRYEWGRLARGVLVFGALYTGAVATSGDRTVLDAVVRLTWLVASLPLLVLARVVGRDQVSAAISGLLRRRPSARG